MFAAVSQAIIINLAASFDGTVVFSHPKFSTSSI
jgi:hypothetical protein